MESLQIESKLVAVNLDLVAAHEEINELRKMLATSVAEKNQYKSKLFLLAERLSSSLHSNTILRRQLNTASAKLRKYKSELSTKRLAIVKLRECYDSKIAESLQIENSNKQLTIHNRMKDDRIAHLSCLNKELKRKVDNTKSDLIPTSEKIPEMETRPMQSGAGRSVGCQIRGKLVQRVKYLEEKLRAQEGGSEALEAQRESLRTLNEELIKLQNQRDVWLKLKKMYREKLRAMQLELLHLRGNQRRTILEHVINSLWDPSYWDRSLENKNLLCFSDRGIGVSCCQS